MRAVPFLRSLYHVNHTNFQYIATGKRAYFGIAGIHYTFRVVMYYFTRTW